MPVSGKRVWLWSNLAGRQLTMVWQSSQVVGSFPAAWFGLDVAWYCGRWQEAQAAEIGPGLPLVWQRAQAWPAWPPASGKLSGCVKVASCQLVAVVLWQSSQRREKPPATWFGLLVAR